MKWPEQTTALLVIHGIGQQSPFQTMGAFAQGFVHACEKSGRKLLLNHGRKYMSLPDGPGWVENFVSCAEREGGPAVDIYEYYWQHLMQRQISFAEIVDWLKRVSDGGSAFYDWMKQQDAFKDRHAGHLRNRVAVVTAAGVDYLRLLPAGVRLAIELMYWLGNAAKAFVPWLYPVLKFFFRKAKRLVVDYVGDVAVYTTTDVKLKHYEVRDRILRAAVGKTQWLLDRYERVVLAGHSLGSVVAYDALNRLNNLMEVDAPLQKQAARLKGLVTFGSPLDKVAFFFYERMGDREFIRRQIVNRSHGFRSLAARIPSKEFALGGGVPKHLDQLAWLNLYDPEDLISGHLDFYDPVANIELRQGASTLEAHTAYWTNDAFYDRVADGIFA